MLGVRRNFPADLRLGARARFGSLADIISVARMESFLLAFGPAILTAIAAFVLQRQLGGPASLSPGKLGVGVIVLVLACCWPIAMTVLDGIGGAVAFIEALIAVSVAVIAALWLLWSLNGRRKIAALLIGILFPASLFVGMRIGANYTPDSVIQRKGAVIAQALNQYRASHGKYPESLDELVPEYLADLKQPGTIWGWLYTATEKEFTLGYVYWVDKFGYSVSVFGSNKPEWTYLSNTTGPFVLQPTPLP